MLKKYKAAAIQYNPTFGKKEENVQQLLQMCTEAANQGAKLIVLPEMATTGYCFINREEIKEEVETIPGATTIRFQEIATQFACYIVVALAEVDPHTDNYYNSCVLIGPNGIVGKYRKTHLYVSDTKWSREGDMGFPVFDTEIGKIGCLICMDFTFFEPARIMALQGVEVLCNPTNWNIEKCPAPSWFSRAWDNGVYVISANRSDQERGVQFAGGSSLIGPDGSLINYLDNEVGIVYGEIDLNKTGQKKLNSGIDKLTDRQPKYYKSLNLNLYLDNPHLTHRLYNYKPLPEGKKLVISVYQFEPQNDFEENYKKISYAVEQAANNNVELLVLPELALSGKIASHLEAQKRAVSLPDDLQIKKITKLANQYNLNLILGVIEKEGNQLYNTVILITKDGLKGKYRKIHLNKMDQKWASVGKDGFTFVDLPLGRIGLLTSDDCIFPESTMSLAVWGVDVIAVPAAIFEPTPISLKATTVPLSPEYTVLGDDPVHWHLWRTRAVETNTFIALANQTGEGGSGNSGIFGPSDCPRYETLLNKEEALQFINIDTSGDGGYPDKQVRIKGNVRMRSPHLYDLLVVEDHKYILQNNR